jgi:hypothetical protein
MSTIDISGIEKYKVIQALYNASQPLGMGFIHYTPEPLSDEEAQEEVEAHTYKGQISFDYLRGRVIKCEISGNEMHPGLFDRDNGAGAAAAAIARIER